MKIVLHLITFFAINFLLLLTVANAQTSLNPGDVAVVAYASDAPDSFAIVTWVDIDPGTEIFFTDKGWDCNGFQSGESVIQYTAPAPGGLKAGSVIAFEDDTDNGPDWNIISGSVSFTSVDGDQLIVYQGTWNNNPNLIFAFDTTGGWESCDAVSNSKQSAIPTGLEDGVSAVSFTHYDNFWYRPWYAKSATIETFKEWMVDYKRFKYTSIQANRDNDYEVPSSFTILNGQRGNSGYTEYYAGTAPCIILTGHDGDIFPSSIDDRNHGCWDAQNEICTWDKTCSPQDDDECRAVTLNDENTQDMARRAVDYFEDFIGERCHLVVNRLGRIKLDPNREILEAAMGDATAIQAYNEFHQFIETARNNVTSTHGAGLVVDFHGHAHPEERIELGYKLTPSNLRDGDEDLDDEWDSSSIKNLASASSPTYTFSTIIRGSNVNAPSMGYLFEEPSAFNASGYESVPGPTILAPGVGESYFQGGYNIEQHGSQYGGTIDAIQIEFPRYLRADNWDSQDGVLHAFAEHVLPEFLDKHYNWI